MWPVDYDVCNALAPQHRIERAHAGGVLAQAAQQIKHRDVTNHASFRANAPGQGCRIIHQVGLGGDDALHLF